MHTSDAGIALIKEFEGFRNRAYQDAAGVWTIGYGTTRYPHGGHVQSGDVCSEVQAEEFIRHDLRWAEDCVNKYTTVPLTQNQFDALVSFTYNLGCGALMKSTLLRRLNAGDYDSAAEEMLRWTHAGGHMLRGLVRRRTEEHDLFLMA